MSECLMIKFSCPHCSHRIKAQLATAGIRSKCPHCKANITVPMPEYLEPIKHEPEREYPKVAVQEKPSVPVAVPLSGVALKKNKSKKSWSRMTGGASTLVDVRSKNSQSFFGKMRSSKLWFREFTIMGMASYAQRIEGWFSLTRRIFSESRLKISRMIKWRLSVMRQGFSLGK